MRVAALYDIHGNLPALEAVLNELREAAVDQVVVGGDVVVGPMARETLQRLLDFPIPAQFIYGNAEVAVLQQMAGTTPPRVPEQYRPAIQWTAEHVADYQATLASWPLTVRLRVEGLGDVLFCHATPRNEDECFTRLTPEDHLLPICDGLGASVIVCGHTHMQFDRTVGRTRVLNAGSIGMPFGDPGADWLLLGPDVDFRHTDYDLANAAERMRATTFPWPEDFAARYVLQPPSAAEMLDIYTRASI
jgi:predicted phosphodiesterase